jgi:hypothetical protein
VNTYAQSGSRNSTEALPLGRLCMYGTSASNSHDARRGGTGTSMEGFVARAMAIRAAASSALAAALAAAAVPEPSLISTMPRRK